MIYVWEIVCEKLFHLLFLVLVLSPYIVCGYAPICDLVLRGGSGRCLVTRMFFLFFTHGAFGVYLVFLITKKSIDQVHVISFSIQQLIILYDLHDSC